ncbi:uncharacterized protein C8A04DRAFT_27578 [Dichotomopilus funicola]|uniref:Extracellular membrane protein CFEM domain-containing protein n=1 Tax=Dichotomopilus funicola TaxID=1934379 RepID=A0AAN6V4K6_9PEZI|nr:hypothetical protein C8A04DRAFT_27578 [Dichotomopilus funicola]
MGLTNYARLALLGTALFFAGPAQADFGFTPCIDDCVASNGCEAYDEKCVCKEANSLLLNSVVSCMYFNCKNDLRDADDTFLSPISNGCSNIPERKLDAAASLASSYSSKLPAATSAKPSPTHDAPSTSDKPHSPSTSDKPEHSPPVPPKPSATTSNVAGPSTSAAAGGAASSSAAQTTLVTSVTPTETSSSPAESTTSSNEGSGSNHNTNPFGSSGDDSAGAAIRPLFALLALPAAVVVGFAFGQ